MAQPSLFCVRANGRLVFNASEEYRCGGRMSIRCEWLDKDANIIIIRFSEKWTLQEFREAMSKLQRHVRQVVGRFDIIADFTVEVLMLPGGLLEAWLTLVEQQDANFPNWGLSVWVMENSIMEAYFETGNELSPIVRRHGRKAKTIVEAVNLITDHRQAQTR